MNAHDRLKQISARFGQDVFRADIPGNDRLYLTVSPAQIRLICHYVFAELDARYVVSIGTDDRPYSGHFLVFHNFAFDADGLLLSLISELPADAPRLASISDLIPAANWGEREIMDMLGIEITGHPYPKRLVLPDGWPEGLHPLRKDMDWNHVPEDFDPDRSFAFDAPPEGCTVVPFGPFHPTLDEPAHFRLYVEGEMVRGCEYRGFMVHRGIEKLAESVMGYNDIPMLAERVCGICGCVHSVAYVQAVEAAAHIVVPPRAEFMRTLMLEMERLHSHLLWVGLACHIAGFDTLFMQAFRIREPVMWISEKITGNRKTYGLCQVGGVRWDITPALKDELRAVLAKLEEEWLDVAEAVFKDKNVQKRTSDVGVASAAFCKRMGLLGPVARAAGVDIDTRRDFPYAAYGRLDFAVITHHTADVWGRVVVRIKEVFESISLMRQCLDLMEPGPLQTVIDEALPVGRLGFASVEAPRGESHHFVITGENNRPRRWRIRAPTYQNLQGVPGMIKDQTLADMTISLGGIDPCFSCTDRMEVIDIRSGTARTWTQEELLAAVRQTQQPATLTTTKDAP